MNNTIQALAQQSRGWLYPRDDAEVEARVEAVEEGFCDLMARPTNNGDFEFRRDGVWLIRALDNLKRSTMHSKESRQWVDRMKVEVGKRVFQIDPQVFLRVMNEVHREDGQ